MNKTMNIQELTIVVVAKSHNPTILNPDFLKYNGIVPADWELAGPPICAEPVAQVIYKNGINIVAQFDKIIFSENIKAGKLEELKVPGIARKYIETLPHVDFQAVGINPKGDVPIPETEAIRFIISTVISSSNILKLFMLKKVQCHSRESGNPIYFQGDIRSGCRIKSGMT